MKVSPSLLPLKSEGASYVRSRSGRIKDCGAGTVCIYSLVVSCSGLDFEEASVSKYGDWSGPRLGFWGAL